MKTIGGASSQYQQVVVELKGLKRALQHLETLEPTDHNANHINCVRVMALASRIPLQQFLDSLEKYEASLGPLSRTKALGVSIRKAQYAIYMEKEVEKLRTSIAAKLIGINLWLASHTS